MQFIDTHAHLYAEDFDEDRAMVVQTAIDLGVKKMFLPNIDVDSIEHMHQLVEAFPKNCFPMMGLHPCSVKENWEDELRTIKKYLFDGDYIAVGEIGMDLYWDKSTLEFQKKAFIQQIEWAKELELPIVIHVREAFEETFEIVDQLNDDRLTGVFHCFTGTVDQANHIIGYGGFKMGLGGVLTFKNSGLDKTVEQIDLEHFVLETDSPYLAPTPHRGKRNQSEYTLLVAKKLAEIKNVDLKDVRDITTKNAFEVFSKVKDH